jgi:uncharacterized protein
MTEIDQATRYDSLDAIRGIAVMGILLMNCIAFSMPVNAYFNPAVYGGTTPPDLISWATMAILVDSKMRGLFSMLFGASMLLVYDRAEKSGGNGNSIHRRRMLWLLLFGLIHFFLIWFGDILVLYALCGLVGMFLLNQSEEGLKRAAYLLLSTNFVILGLMMLGMHGLEFAATLPGASPELVNSYTDMVADTSDATASAAEIALYRGGYWGIVSDKLTNDLFTPLITFFESGLETLGLMALGMLFFRNGFLTGSWDDSRYKRAMKRAYLIGFPPLILLTLWTWLSGFDPIVALATMVAWTAPFRVIVTIGHAALIMLMIRKFAKSALMPRIIALGKAAFSNYLGTSILMTTLFYGYGFGLFGHFSRWQVYLVVPGIWIIMLLWSKPWLDHYRYGPLEWLWRSLARWKLQPMRR